MPILHAPGGDSDVARMFGPQDPATRLAHGSVYPIDLLVAPTLLVLVEPDLGTAGTIALVGFSMILVVGVLCLVAGWTYTGGPRPYGYLGLTRTSGTNAVGGEVESFFWVALSFRDGKIARETAYWADPFEAPAWRSQWVDVSAAP